MLGSISPRATTARLVRLDFSTPDPVWQATRLLQVTPRPIQFLVDCRQLPGLRTRGVADFVTQLLKIRQLGAQLHLQDVPARLAHLLHLLRLDTVFLAVPNSETLAAA